MRTLLLLTFYVISIPFSVLGHNHGHWTLTWNDEFNDSGLPNTQKWDYDVGGHGWGNKELQYYTAARNENVSIENGILKINAIKENYKGNKFTSARLVTRNIFEFEIKDIFHIRINRHCW